MSAVIPAHLQRKVVLAALSYAFIEALVSAIYRRVTFFDRNNKAKWFAPTVPSLVHGYFGISSVRSHAGVSKDRNGSVGGKLFHCHGPAVLRSCCLWLCGKSEPDRGTKLPRAGSGSRSDQLHYPWVYSWANF